jgi:hypothetical protein
MLLIMVDWFDVDVCNFSFGYDLLSEVFLICLKKLLLLEVSHCLGIKEISHL